MSGEEDRSGYLTSSLSIVVVGASGDLAKKKTFPSLLNLYAFDLLPKNIQIWGYARSNITSEDLRENLLPFLHKLDYAPEVVGQFLSLVHYQRGSSYGDLDALTQLKTNVEAFESIESESEDKYFNRLFYFAIPPNVFAQAANAIKQTCMQEEAKGWTRLVVEKPFGKDLKSFEDLNKDLSAQFTEDHLYRIDHYLGKEMVQNLTVIRFSNMFFERIWNRDNIQMVILTFKEPFGTEGRGGYFDQFGIIRDILQNHLLQVLTLLTCEPPSVAQGPDAGNAIRDAKLHVLNSIPPIKLEDCVLGQYEGYADDPSIENKDTQTPTFAAVRLKINNPRWAGVPIILKAGKALDERKAEMRLQLRDAPAAQYLFNGQNCPRNEIVLRLQPDETIYLKTNVKKPGFHSEPIQTDMSLDYDTRFFTNHKQCKKCNPDAYTRLILDVLEGQQGAFVRDDELRQAWKIFSPVLEEIDRSKIRPFTYPQGSRGPVEADEFIAKCGFDYTAPNSKA